MNIQKQIKTFVEKVPEPIGKRLAWVPFSLRFGPAYHRARREIHEYGSLHKKERELWVFQRFNAILQYAYEKVPFYRRHFEKNGFHPSQLRCFSDLSKVPVTTRSELQAFTVEERSQTSPGAMLINTGGTSGEPLEFFIDGQAFAREWAHMHFIWEKLGYRQTQAKATLRGKNLGPLAIRYNPVHNEYVVNAYAPYDSVVSALEKPAREKRIKFLHGYPSAIYEFTRYCLDNSPRLIKILRSSLKGVLLGSEYPAPVYRNLIEETYRAPTISWYGHSEMALLAYETDKYVYAPLQSYGFCEAVPDENGKFRLVGTSYYNTASPFIRYDTGDFVEPVENDGVLESFKITEGRVGEFISDAKDKKVSLTALIFGRHHALFGWARFVQIRQERSGKAAVLITKPPNLPITEKKARDGFDASNVDIQFSFELRDEPVRTAAGKVPLLIKAGENSRG